MKSNSTTVSSANLSRVRAFSPRSLTLALGAALAAASPALALTVDFEGGSSAYDNAVGQTTGLFRDTSGNGQVNLSSNGSGNDYLVLSGTGTGATVYDTTPSNATAGTASTFLIGAGQSATYSVEVQSTTNALNGGFAMGFYNPNSAAGFGGYGFTFYLNAGAGDPYNYQTARNSSFNFFYSAPGTNINLNDVPNNIFRIEITFTNNEANTGATLSTNIHKLSDFGGSIVSTLVSGVTQSITYGIADTSTNAQKETLNFDPANTGLGIYLGGNPQNQTLNIDNLGFTVSTVPEPASASALLGASALLLVGARRRR